ncbi:MAG: phage holin family protein [Patescibacteria group bacterium]|nr:phage holin family protein [Patescibacteria group bacterium]
MNFLVNLLISSLAIFVTAYILPGIELTNFWTAIVVALVLGLVNAIIRPFLIIITLPINILTLGLFTLVINALLVLLVSAIVPGFHVRSFGWAVLFGLILTLINWVIYAIL